MVNMYATVSNVVHFSLHVFHRSSKSKSGQTFHMKRNTLEKREYSVASSISSLLSIMNGYIINFFQDRASHISD
jgi:hypothetical protein